MQKVRRRFLIASGALFAPAVLRAQGSRPARTPRVGVLLLGGPTMNAGINAFREGMREIGYIEGRDVIFELRFADGDMARLPWLAKDLVEKKVDVILAAGTYGAQVAKAATSVIPIVAHGVADMEESRLVASLAKPGGNLTGMAVAFPETAAKQLELIREAVPRGKRVAVLSPAQPSPFFERQRRELEARASNLMLTWHATGVQSELEPTFQAIQRSRADFLVSLSDAFYFAHRRELTRLSAEARIPAVYGFREYVDDGGLMSYGASLTESTKRAAGYVDKILKGAKPGDLPVEQPTTFELAINNKTARAIGLTIPPALALRADQIVE